MQGLTFSDPEHRYPIDAACSHGWGLDVIEMMLDAGAADQLLSTAGHNRLGFERKFPFLSAARNANLALMRLLLEKGGDEQVLLMDREGVGILLVVSTRKLNN